MSLQSALLPLLLPVLLLPPLLSAPLLVKQAQVTCSHC